MRVNTYGRFAAAASSKASVPSIDPEITGGIKAELSKKMLMPNGSVVLAKVADAVYHPETATTTVPVTPVGPDVAQTSDPAVNTSGWDWGSGGGGGEQIISGGQAATADMSIWDKIMAMPMWQKAVIGAGLLALGGGVVYKLRK